MSVLTQFFVASAYELRSFFPGWLPVRPEPVPREVVNPFTRKKSIVMTWVPAVAPPAGATPKSGEPDLGNVARIGVYRIDHVKLARLFVIVEGGELRTRIKQLVRPALIHPAESHEMGLHAVDEEFTVALAGLDDSTAAKAAAEWAQTEEMQRDRFTAAKCETALRELVKLARRAQKSRKGLYFFWSL